MCFEVKNAMTYYRKQKGITQEELALRCGMSQCTISELENDVHLPTLLTAYIIARELDVNITNIWQIKEIETC